MEDTKLTGSIGLSSLIRRIYGKSHEWHGCNLGSREEGYSFDEALKGFTVFKFKDESLKTYWIRDDLYQSNYHNVVETLENYTGSWRYIHSPICACIENKYY